VSKGKKKAPEGRNPVGGPTRSWRTLTRLFLVGLRPRRARLRFTGHRYYIDRGQGARKGPRENTGGSVVEQRGCIGPSC
jgi:hypothetical protein